MFMLEALKARHGDCLLLHWGTSTAPSLALIDGGPERVYREVLRPRLRQLAQAHGDVLPIELLMVSHIDDDHINGVLDLAVELDGNTGHVMQDDGAMPVRVLRLWHNSLEGLLDDDLATAQTRAVTASVASSLADLGGTNTNGKDSKGTDTRGTDKAQQLGMVLASVPQGQQLHALANKLKWKMNPGFSAPPLVTQRQGGKTIALKGLTLKVLGPSLDAVEALRKAWRTHRKDEVLAAYSDRSPYNLSSIIVLAGFDGATMLLTGDARGDHVLEGLEQAGLLDKEGRIHVDVLKLPHHGSKNNVTPEFFERIAADHYVVSGDCVRFPNPAKDAMDWLKQARGKDDYTVHCTYDLEYMHDIFGERLEVPTGASNSVTVSIGGCRA